MIVHVDPRAADGLLGPPLGPEPVALRIRRRAGAGEVDELPHAGRAGRGDEPLGAGGVDRHERLAAARRLDRRVLEGQCDHEGVDAASASTSPSPVDVGVRISTASGSGPPRRRLTAMGQDADGWPRRVELGRDRAAHESGPAGDRHGHRSAQGPAAAKTVRIVSARWRKIRSSSAGPRACARGRPSGPNGTAYWISSSTTASRRRPASKVWRWSQRRYGPLSWMSLEAERRLVARRSSRPGHRDAEQRADPVVDLQPVAHSRSSVRNSKPIDAGVIRPRFSGREKKAKTSSIWSIHLEARAEAMHRHGVVAPAFGSALRGERRVDGLFTVLVSE